jgi:hypothetical protein
MQAPAWFPALSAGERRFGPPRFQGHREAQSVLALFQNSLAEACRILHLRVKERVCISCQAKRAMLFAEKLTTEILAPVPHRHWIFSIPRFLRGLFERERKLLGLPSQTAYASILETFQALFERQDVRPGCVVALQTFGT